MMLPTIFANSGNRIAYADAEHTILHSGIASDGEPYVELEPPNPELRQRMIEQIRQHGNLRVRLGCPDMLVLGEDEYPYFR